MKRGPGLSSVTAAWCLTIFAGLLTAVGSGCSETVGGDELVDPSDGSLRGELAVYVADDFERGAQTRYAIRSTSGQERWLDFDVDPGIEAGSQVRVWGAEVGERFRVTSVKQIAPPEQPITSELRMGMTYKPKRLAFIVVNIGGTPNLTLEQAKARIVGPNTNATTNPALKYYYAEASYGTEELDGDAFAANYPTSACDYSGMARTLRTRIDEMGGGAFNHYLWYFGTRVGSCGWAGLGQVGTPASPAKDTWYNASSSCVVLVQEPGHNFGMQHSASMTCPNAPFADQPNGTCTHGEYGDPYDPMGGGCRHMNVWQKLYNGWLQGCNAVRVRATGKFTLVPLELACDGAQALQIPMPKTRSFSRSGGGGSASTNMLTHYYLELRTKRGVDTAMTTSVLVHAGSNIVGRSGRGLHTWILDMDKSANGIQGLTAGKSFEDPAGGVSFMVTELDESHATIEVTMTADGGGPVCLDGTTPFQAPGPGIESCNPGVTQPGGGMGGMTGGTGGAGGNMGTGGAGGDGGRGTGGSGTTGTGGRGSGGSTGSGGRGGAGGMTGGTGGSTGTGGAIGSGGSTTTGTGGRGTGGSVVVPPGTGGSTPPPPIGTGGTVVEPPGTGGSTTTRDGGTNITTGPVTGGCACEINSGTGGTETSSVSLLLVVGGMALARARRRRRR